MYLQNLTKMPMYIPHGLVFREDAIFIVGNILFHLSKTVSELGHQTKNLKVHNDNC